MLIELLAGVRRGLSRREMESLVAELMQANDRLRLENAQLRRENRHLRRRLQDAELRLLRRAEADAALITAFHFGGLATSRRACESYGISRRRWAWARALLNSGGALTSRGGWTDLDVAGYEIALRRASGRIEQQGIELLRRRLPQG